MKIQRVTLKLMAILMIFTVSICLCSCTTPNNSNNTLPDNNITPTSPTFVTENPTPSNTNLTTSKKLTIHFIDVGQGDSIYIELPNDENMLIDAGGSYDGNPTTAYINSLNINNITYLIATHPHADHINYMADVIQQYSVENIYMPNATTNTKTFEKVLNAISAKNSTINAAKRGDIILDTDDLDIIILNPSNSSYDDLNKYSVVVKIIYKNTSMLFMGDAEKENEDELQGNINVDLVKIGHHGSGTSSSSDFVSKTSAQFAIISVGQDNSYGHPHQNIVDRWKNSGAQVYTTQNSGTIIATSDGKSITISTEYQNAITNNNTNTIEGNTPSSTTWILNTNSKKIHYIDCTSAQQISSKNRAESTEQFEILIQQGYSACGTCKPHA